MTVYDDLPPLVYRTQWLAPQNLRHRGLAASIRRRSRLWLRPRGVRPAAPISADTDGRDDVRMDRPGSARSIRLRRNHPTRGRRRVSALSRFRTDEHPKPRRTNHGRRCQRSWARLHGVGGDSGYHVAVGFAGPRANGCHCNRHARRGIGPCWRRRSDSVVDYVCRGNRNTRPDCHTHPDGQTHHDNDGAADPDCITAGKLSAM
jgi:hypothetical protein